MKRIALFLLTNLAVVVVLGIVASLLGVNRYLTAKVRAFADFVAEIFPREEFR